MVTLSFVLEFSFRCTNLQIKCDPLFPICFFLVTKRSKNKNCPEIQVYFKAVQVARHQWFTPVILATWEAKIGRISI
jgi:hypothetical protein